MISIIIYKEYLDWKLVSYDCLEFLKIHHNTSITFKTYSWSSLTAYACSYCSWKSITHTCNGTIICHSASLLDNIRLISNNTTCSVRYCSKAVFWQLTAHISYKCIYISSTSILFPLSWLYYRIILLPFLCSSKPFITM